MKITLHTIFTLFTVISSAMATDCIASNSEPITNIKEIFWQQRYNNDFNFQSYKNACRDEVARTELLICRNHHDLGASSFWEYLPPSKKSFEKFMSKGFKENAPRKKVNFFQQAIDYAYDSLSYTVVTLCLAEAYLQNKDYIDALVLYRSFAKHSRPIIQHHQNDFRTALQDKKLVNSWKAKNPHLVKKLELAEKLYQHELDAPPY